MKYLLKGTLQFMSGKDIETAATCASLLFLKRSSLKEHEKLYTLSYKPSDGFPMRNFEEGWIHDVPLYDIRRSMDELSLDRQGFIVATPDSSLSYEEFWDEELLRTTYARELKVLFKGLLNARAVAYG